MGYDVRKKVEEEYVEHDVPSGGYFQPKLYLQRYWSYISNFGFYDKLSFERLLKTNFRYSFVKKYILRTKARTVIDLGCGEAKFVRELAQMNLRRVIGIDFDKYVLDIGSNYMKPNFDDHYNPGFKRKENLLIELYRYDFKYFLKKIMTLKDILISKNF